MIDTRYLSLETPLWIWYGDIWSTLNTLASAWTLTRQKGYAPGSWSQVCDAGIFSSDILTHNFRKVAANRTHPNGRVVGIDILPAQPPKGVSTLQGDFLSPAIQAELRAYISDPDRGRPRPRHTMVSRVDDAGTDSDESDVSSSAESERGYLEMERLNTQEPSAARTEESQDDLDSSQQEYEERGETEKDHRTPAERDRDAGRVVDVVLSDMCEPWDQTAGFGKKSVSDPYRRMMNTSGMPFRDHAGSMVCLDVKLSSRLFEVAMLTALRRRISVWQR